MGLAILGFIALVFVERWLGFRAAMIALCLMVLPFAAFFLWVATQPPTVP